MHVYMVKVRTEKDGSNLIKSLAIARLLISVTIQFVNINL